MKTKYLLGYFKHTRPGLLKQDEQTMTPRNVSTTNSSLLTHVPVTDPRKSLSTWIHYCSLDRNGERFQLVEQQSASGNSLNSTSSGYNFNKHRAQNAAAEYAQYLRNVTIWVFCTLVNVKEKRERVSPDLSFASREIVALEKMTVEEINVPLVRAIAYMILHH